MFTEITEFLNQQNNLFCEMFMPILYTSVFCLLAFPAVYRKNYETEILFKRADYTQLTVPAGCDRENCDGV